MTDREADEEIIRKVRAKYPDVFDETIKVAVFDVPGYPKPIADWHVEVVEKIDNIRNAEAISAAQAGCRVYEPFFEEHSISFESFMDAYWTTKRDLSLRDFVYALSERDDVEIVRTYRKLSKQTKVKIGLL